MSSLNSFLGLSLPMRKRNMLTTRPPSINESQPAPPTAGRPSRRDLLHTGFSRLIQALQVTKDLSSACPQLQTAIGVLLIVLEAYKNYSDAMESLDILLTRMEPLRKVIVRALPAGEGYDRCPKELQERLEAFASKVQSVAQEAKELKHRHRIVRFLNASDYSEKIDAWVKKLTWHIHSFILEGTIAIELSVHEMAADMRQGFGELEHRVGEVHNEVVGLRSDIQQQGTEGAIPGLRYTPRARFDYGQSGRSQCDEGTRDEVLKTIYLWLRPEDQALERFDDFLPSLKLLPDRSILWIYALAGAGKTTLAETVAQWCHERECLGSSFFCARDGDRSDVQCIAQNIASDLAHHCPEFKEALLAAVKDNPYISSASAAQQVKILLVGPVQVATGKGASWKRRVVVIDALDECKDDSAESTFLQALSLYIKELAPLLFIITSRPVPNITRGFQFLEELRKRTLELPIDAIPSALTARDITTFLRRRFAEIGRRHASAGPSWVSEEQLQRVSQLAEGLFIYAATVASLIEAKNVVDPRHQLDILLSSVHRRPTNVSAGTPETRLEPLDQLYYEVLRIAFGEPYSLLQARLKRVLGTIALAEERLSPLELSALLGEDVGSVLDIIERLRSVLSFSSEHTAIRIIHLSFADFLVDPKRCKSPHFLVTPSIQHTFIVLRCLELMQTYLKFNICEVPSEHQHLPNDEIPGMQARMAQHFPPALAYACRYWMRHLGSADIGEELLLTLEEFCKTRLLYWLEALSLLGCVEIAVEALRSTQLLLKNASLRETQVPALLYDCERIVQAFYPVISTSFMEIYHTAIPYSPIDSLLRRGHLADVSQSVEVSLGLEKTWSTTFASRATGFGSISALSFSPDGMHVACGTNDGPVLLLNVHTGAQLHVFEGHTDTARTVSFSPTGHEILSGSFDTTARLWDVATGACLHTWTEHSDHEVGSVAWSPDGLVVASGDGDGAVLLRKINLPERTVVLQHENWVGALIFATDGYIASGSDDETCKIWDTKSIDWDATDHSPRRTLTHSSMVREVAVSLDSCLVACGLESGEIVLWSKPDGERLRSIPGRTKVISLAFYADNHLAAAYLKSPFLLWDVSSATHLDSLDSAFASACAFLSDGLHIAQAASNTVYIRRWSGHELRQSGLTTTAQSSLTTRMKRHLGSHSPAPLPTPAMRAGEVVDDTSTRLFALAVSPTGALVLAVYEDQWRLWDVSNGPPRHMRSAEHSAFDGSVASWSTSGDLFTCTGNDHVISVWETQTGQRVRAFAGHSDMVTAVVFTADEQHVLSASGDGSICRWDVRSTPRDAPSKILFEADGDEIDALAVSSDGRWMLSGSSRPYSPPDTLSADLLARPSRQPVEDDVWYCALRLHDATGRVVWIENHPMLIASVAFSEDCSRALAGDYKGGVFLYDLTQLISPGKSGPHASQPLAVPEYQFNSGSTREVRHVSLSLDDQAIVTERSYIALSPELQPLLKRAAPVSWPPSYFLTDDGWLWRVDPQLNHRRIRWVPPSFRPHPDDFLRTWSSQHGHGVACRTSDGRLAVLDVSQY